MIDYATALELILDNAPGPGPEERIPLALAADRILGADAVSDVDLPPFDKSGMDGFAVRAADVARAPVELPVVQDVPAGGVPSGPLEPGQAASVMTGAPVPAGADTVIQVEWTSGFGKPTVTIERGAPRGLNVSPRAEILAAGQTVLPAGARIDVEEHGLLAAVGCDPVPVYPRPSIALLSTGDEIVPPSVRPGPSQIRDVNGPALVAFVRSLGLEPTVLPTVPDDPGALRAALEQGLEHDCLLLSGGVSAGAYDFVEDVLEEFGIAVHTRRIAIKPGKPTVFGTRDDRMVFGLPGNPVSVMVVARVLVEPALAKRQGLGQRGPRTIAARLTTPLRKKTDRLWFVPGQLDFSASPTVTPLSPRGSADLPTAARSDCLVVAPKDAGLLEAGATVKVVVWPRATRTGPRKEQD